MNRLSDTAQQGNGDSPMKRSTPAQIAAAKKELSQLLIYKSGEVGGCLAPLAGANVAGLNDAAFRMMLTPAIAIAKLHGIDMLKDERAGKALTETARQSAERAVRVMREGAAL